MKRTLLAVAAVATLGLTACGASSNPTTPASSSAASGGSVVVGGANFSESTVLAEVYAAALRAKGVNASTRPNIGSREVYLKALDDKSVDILPEYTGSLLTYLKPDATAKGSDEVYTALKAALPANWTVLNKSAAEDKNSLVVTKDSAAKWNLTSIGDLVAHQSEITLGAPPEFQTRQQGLVGLKSEYGFVPKAFIDRSGKASVDALVNGQVQVANIFSTTPWIAVNSFVTLDDPKLLFGSDNVVPLLRKDAVTDQISTTLNAVSAKLTTPVLTDLIKQVDIDKKDATVVAKDFVTNNGLG
ncbi:MAG: ABC transporter substrate-binding protein [Dermatophilaceae bacterium]